ncbi:unnamed protein product [Closterium sp. NIES-65]|nr:unnamed protein product [Closterium sp. NIES-65]
MPGRRDVPRALLLLPVRALATTTAATLLGTTPTSSTSSTTTASSAAASTASTSAASTSAAASTTTAGTTTTVSAAAAATTTTTPATSPAATPTPSAATAATATAPSSSTRALAPLALAGATLCYHHHNMALTDGPSTALPLVGGPQRKKSLDAHPELITPKTLFNGASAVNELTPRTSALRINDQPAGETVNTSVNGSAPAASSSDAVDLDKGKAKVNDADDDGGYLSDDPDDIRTRRCLMRSQRWLVLLSCSWSLSPGAKRSRTSSARLTTC